MTRTLIVGAALLLASRTTSAQLPGAAAKAAAQKAAAATNAHIESEQRTDEPQKPAARPVAPNQVPVAQVPPKSAPTGAAGKTPQTSVARPAGTLSVASAGETVGPPPSILREVYEYGKDGRRDPFVSLLTTNDLRPTMSDLRLTGILYDHTGRRSVATLRDVATNAQYRVMTGSTLGRMRVAAIRLKTVLFTIDEFGTTRQDSLVIGDSTKARGK